MDVDESRTKTTGFSRFITDFLERDEEWGKQETLAVDLGVDSSTITGWKRGAKPDVGNVLKVASHFRIHPVEVFRMAERESDAKQFEEWCGRVEFRKCTDADVYKRAHLALHRSLEMVLQEKDKLDPKALTLVETAISHAENLLASRADPQEVKRKTGKSGRKRRR